MSLVQKLVVVGAENASPTIPMTVALVNPDGTPYGGAGATQMSYVADVADAPTADDFNNLLAALRAAGMMVANNQGADQASSFEEDTALEEALYDAPVSEPEAGGLQVTVDERSTNVEIAAFAAEHGIDLGGATTKADMLAVIRAAA